MSEKSKIKSFVIVGTQRTGSSMIAGTLHSHPDINCGWEWAIDIPPLKKIALIKAGLSGQFEVLPEPHASMMSKKGKTDVTGFRLLFSSSPKWFIHQQYNLAHMWERLSGFIKFFQQNPEIKIIQIIREDQLAWIASLFMAKSSKLYINKKYPKDLKVKIPVKKAIKRLKSKTKLEKMLRTLHTSNPYIELKYEEILTRREAALIELFDFLEVSSPGTIPDAPIKKQQHRPISEVVVNYNDIRQAILKF